MGEVTRKLVLLAHELDLSILLLVGVLESLAIPYSRAIPAVWKRHYGLLGRSRRRLMARQFYDERSGAQILEIVPTWACDPMPARNDAGPPRDLIPLQGAVDAGSPDHLRWIDRAVSELSRSTPVRAMVLRHEFCESGTQVEKAAAVEALYGGRFSVWQYRRELQRAMDFLGGRSAVA
ncbi:hypothetical protein ABIE09_001593 [Lysobacter enzymogenes]|uniref:hypothetical protein n=1 Tax=Lysobacter enzymogenes TaxID=69 RepID=UPI00339A7130